MQERLRDGIENMLVHCAGLRPGQAVLILTEDGDEGYYDPGLAPAVAEVAGELGLEVRLHRVPFKPVADPGAEVLDRIAQADCTVFLARLGDQLRFDALLTETAPVMCYALDREMMGSGFGRAEQAAMRALLDCLNGALAGAGEIHVTCPLGTDFRGPGACFPAEAGEVTIRRFPLSVFTPVPAGSFAGRIVQSGFLTGTGKTHYAPYNLALDDLLTVHFEGSRITRFEGRPGDVARARAHYDRVGAMTGSEALHVHSWHAGMHPGCAWPTQAGADIARWGGAAFGNPRLLHFHTCGTEAPGEISLNVVDPTIRIDGVPVWDDGRLCPERVAGGRDILGRYPVAAGLFAGPRRAVGLAPSGRLRASVEAQPDANVSMWPRMKIGVPGCHSLTMP